jgi:hypothetical protein
MRITHNAIFLLLAALFVMSGVAFAQIEPDRETGTPVLVEEHWPDGQLRLQKHVLRLDDGGSVDHGTFVRWYDNGTKEYEAVFVLGRKEGTTVRFHRNGQKATRQEYSKGQRHGRSTSWNNAGVKVKEENWAEGKPHGSWTIWKNGKLKWSQTYNHGTPEALPENPVSQ